MIAAAAIAALLLPLDASVSPGDNQFYVIVEENKAPVVGTPGSPGPADDNQQVATPQEIRCDDTTGACITTPGYQCADPEAVYTIYYIPSANGGWQIYSQGCQVPGEAIPIAITPAMVLAELRRVGLPALTVSTDPSDKTLVNLETVFHTDPEPVTRTFTLLGQQVTVEASATSYAWDFGDGTTVSTNQPGAPYPAGDIVHRYERDSTVAPRVTASYTGRFRVNGGAWTDIVGAVTIPGPATELRVAEATPVLASER